VVLVEPQCMCHTPTVTSPAMGGRDCSFPAILCHSLTGSCLCIIIVDPRKTEEEDRLDILL